MRFRPVALVAALLAPAPAARAAEPEWKWEKPFYVECRLDTVADFAAGDAGGKRKKDTTEGRVVFRVTPQPNEDGTVRLVHEIVAAKLTEETETARTEKKMFAKLAGAKFAITRSADGSLSGIQGMAKVVDHMLGDAPAGVDVTKAKAGLEAIFSAAIRSLLGEAYFPVGRVAKGGRVGPVSDTLSIAGLAVMKAKKTYTPDGTGADGGKTYPRWKMTAAVTIAPSDAESPVLSFRVVEFKADKPIENTAELLFDPAAGRARRVVMTSVAAVTLTVESGDQKVTVTGTEKRTVTIRYSDENPDKKK